MNKIRLLLRSVYLKGHQDALTKTADMSWEDKIVKDILSALLEDKGAPKDKVNTTGNPRNDEYIAEYNQANSDWRTYLKKKLED